MAKKSRNLKGARKHQTVERADVQSVYTKNNVGQFLKKNVHVIKFIGQYLFYIALFTGTYVIFQEKFVFLSTLTANTLSVLLSILGVESSSYGQSVYMNGFSMMVIDECTGMYELLVYAGCVLAYPTKLRNKLLGIILGLPAMLIINMLRLVLLSFVGMIYPAFFSYVHYYLWQVTFIFLIVLLMLMWIEKVVKSGSI
ncbi:archaeosortase B [Methanolobus psychrotolerans]|uniref:archaeosortase B n=1 Tax=Methanolobus psychrotolerans TaxID=1874706 RepID=UPI000B91CD98|nr:archaeosortase B [Methanolobus psychrotolerans]